MFLCISLNTIWYISFTTYTDGREKGCSKKSSCYRLFGQHETLVLETTKAFEVLFEQKQERESASHDGFAH